MRNRIYITSLYNKSDIVNNASGDLTDSDVKNWTFNHKNILTFVPSLNGLFISGKKYRSLDDVKNHKSVNSVFRLAVFHEYTNNNIHDTNYIALIQNTLQTKLGINSLIIDVPHTFLGKSFSIDMNIGDRVQVFMNYNGSNNIEWECLNSDKVVIDRNYIIHALNVTQSGQNGIINLKVDGVVLYTIQVRVWGNGINLTSNEISAAIIQEIAGTGNNNYDSIINVSGRAGRTNNTININAEIHEQAMERPERERMTNTN